jgi:hypothetical protein
MSVLAKASSILTDLPTKRVSLDPAVGECSSRAISAWLAVRTSMISSRNQATRSEDCNQAKNSEGIAG